MFSLCYNFLFIYNYFGLVFLCSLFYCSFFFVKKFCLRNWWWYTKLLYFMDYLNAKCSIKWFDIFADISYHLNIFYSLLSKIFMRFTTFFVFHLSYLKLYIHMLSLKINIFLNKLLSKKLLKNFL